MNKALILFDKVGAKAKELAKGSNADAAVFGDLAFLLRNGKVKAWVGRKEITDYKLIYIRKADPGLFSMAGSLAVSLNFLKINFIDRAFGETGTYTDKFTQYIKLTIAGLPVFPTLFCMRGSIENITGMLEKEIGFPLVAKEINTQRGVGVFMVKDIKSLADLPVKNTKGRDAHYLFQKYIKLAREYRFLVLGDKVVLVNENIIRKKGEFRHNVCLGASYKYLDLQKVPAQMKRIAVKAAKATNLQVAGVDIGVSEKGEYLLLEVNRGPGFESPEINEFSKYIFKIMKN